MKSSASRSQLARFAAEVAAGYPGLIVSTARMPGGGTVTLTDPAPARSSAGMLVRVDGDGQPSYHLVTSGGTVLGRSKPEPRVAVAWLGLLLVEAREADPGRAKGTATVF